jgi:hypothetical protein
VFPSEATRHRTWRGPKSGLISQCLKHLARGRHSQLERCYWQMLLSKLSCILAVLHSDREICAPGKGTSPTAWQHRYSYPVQPATSSDSRKATSAVVQLLGHVKNSFKLSLLWRCCINVTSSGEVSSTRHPSNNSAPVGGRVGGRCRWLLYELASGYRICFWRWFIAQLAQIVAKIMALQAVILIILISLKCKCSWP